ncbi:MAG: ATP-binding protein [bacterium]
MKKELLIKILQILNRSESLQTSLQQILTLFKATGFDAVGIRLKDGDDFPYFAQEGFSEEFLLKENTLIKCASDAGFCIDADGKVCLECTCGLVLSNPIYPTHPLLTPGGSFWTNDSFSLLEIPSEDDLRYNPRNVCIHHGYASVALVPIQANNTIVGLIQFNDRRKERFTIELIEFFEDIASHIGEALMRKQVEQELMFNNLILKAQNEASIDGILVVDEHGNILHFNQRFVLMWDISPDVMVSKSYKDFLALVIDTHTTTGDILHNLQYLYEFRYETSRYDIVMKDGRIFESYSVPMFSQDDKYYGRMWNFRDITDQKHNEQTIRAFAQTLEIEVQKRTRQLNTLMSELAFRNEELQQFIFIASHDMAEPLVTLSNFSHLLHEEYAGKLDETGNTCIEFISASSIRMRSQIKSLLDYLVLSNKVPLTMVDCAVLVDNVLLDLSCIIQETSAHIIVETLPSIFGNETELVLLFQHLITNAIKFRQLDVCPEIHISVQRHSDAYIFLIEDNGIGIDSRHQNKVFHMFKQTHKRNIYDGFGMGLSYCRKIVTKYGGKIWVKSELGKGSRFYFSIPLSP